MRRKRFSEEQIAFALRQAEGGTTIEEICRKVGISESTLYRWKKVYAGMGINRLVNFAGRITKKLSPVSQRQTPRSKSDQPRDRWGDLSGLLRPSEVSERASQMPKKRLNAEQIVMLLRQIEVPLSQDKTPAVACQEAGISQQSYYRWRKKYGGLELDQAKRMKELERENVRLRRLAADPSLEKQGFKECSPGKLVGPEGCRQTVEGIRAKYGLSEHHACRIVDPPHGTQQYTTIVRADEDAPTRTIVSPACRLDVIR